MKNKKIIEFLKERWQHILLWLCGVLLVLFILIGKNCNAPPTLKAYQTNIDNLTDKSYAIFTYDEVVFGTDESPLYFSLPVTNKYYDIDGEQNYTNQFIMNYNDTEIALVRMSNPDPYVSNYYFQGFLTNYISLRSDYMYIPPNLSDYYTLMGDTITFQGMYNALTPISPLNFVITYDIYYDNENYEHVQETITLTSDNGIYIINTFGEIDLSAFVFDNGCIIKNYSLTLDLTNQYVGVTAPLSSITIEKVGVIQLPNEPLYPPFAEICEDCEICPILPPQGVDVGSFLANSVGAFMDFEIFPGFSISGLLATILAVGLFILFLKVFAGG